MDNSQFRDLLQTKHDGGISPPGFKKPTLGSRARPSIPMTPRTIAGQNASKMFAQQVADFRKQHDGQPPTKKFKSSAPKGSKFAAGYQDRTQARHNENESDPDDRAKRLKALEEMYKLQQIDEATFENLKKEIGIGGDLSSTHLVKGLDWKLLERVRRGDDLNKSEMQKNEQVPKVNVDDELDQALQQDVKKTERTSRGDEEEAIVDTEQPLSRNEILRRLKESRAGNTASAAPEPVLGEHFKKVKSDKLGKKKFVEVINGRRREVLLIQNKDGTTKRKTRWLETEEEATKNQQTQPLGMEVPAEMLAKQKAMLEQEAAEDEDDDIFQGVSDYNPLAGIDSGSDDAADETTKPRIAEDSANSKESKPRNYFGTSNQEVATEQANPLMTDPTILAALKRAATLGQGTEGDDVALDPEKALRHKQMLARMKQQEKADAEDLDLGFGESRFADDDDQGEAGWDDDGEGGAKKPTRKRGGKKRKGDKDNVNDVMAVLQGRNESKST
jgi:hypothetical protein